MEKSASVGKKKGGNPELDGLHDTVKTPRAALHARQFLQAYLAMERPNSTHLFYSKGILDFLVGILVGVVIGIIISVYL